MYVCMYSYSIYLYLLLSDVHMYGGSIRICILIYKNHMSTWYNCIADVRDLSILKHIHIYRNTYTCTCTYIIHVRLSQKTQLHTTIHNNIYRTPETHIERTWMCCAMLKIIGTYVYTSLHIHTSWWLYLLRYNDNIGCIYIYISPMGHRHLHNHINRNMHTYIHKYIWI